MDPVIKGILGESAFLIAVILLAMSRTDSSTEQFSQTFSEEPARVTCHSRGKLIYDSLSTETFHGANGECHIDCGAPKPPSFKPLDEARPPQPQ